MDWGFIPWIVGQLREDFVVIQSGHPVFCFENRDVRYGIHFKNRDSRWVPPSGSEGLKIFHSFMAFFSEVCGFPFVGRFIHQRFHQRGNEMFFSRTPEIRSSKSEKQPNARGNRNRELRKPNLEQLEYRQMMDGSGLNILNQRIDIVNNRNLLSPPEFSSNPGAPRTIYLDFNGHTQKQWTRTDVTPNVTFNNVVSAAFDTDGRFGFSDSEIAQIRDIWSRVAEDFAPFNVNVTTKQTVAWGSDDRYVVVGGKDFLTPEHRGGYSSASNVVYVFSEEIKSMVTDHEGKPANLAAATASTASHEVGHTFGLSHDRRYDNTGKYIDDYSRGDADWTPIMGDCLSVDRTVWSTNAIVGEVKDVYGRFAGYERQNQLDVLSGVLGLREDEAGDRWTNAKDMPSILITSTNKYGVVPGIIGTSTDSDWFHFRTDGGTNSITLNTSEFGANLEAKMTLWESIRVGAGIRSQQVVRPIFESVGFNLGLVKNLVAGSYFVSIQGNNTAPIQGKYANVGQYTLSVGSSVSAAPSVGTMASGANALQSKMNAQLVSSTPLSSSKVASTPSNSLVRSNDSVAVIAETQTSKPVDNQRSGTKNSLRSDLVDDVFADLSLRMVGQVI